MHTWMKLRFVQYNRIPNSTFSKATKARRCRCALSVHLACPIICPHVCVCLSFSLSLLVSLRRQHIVWHHAEVVALDFLDRCGLIFCPWSNLKVGFFGQFQLINLFVDMRQAIFLRKQFGSSCIYAAISAHIKAYYEDISYMTKMTSVIVWPIAFHPICWRLLYFCFW